MSSDLQQAMDVMVHTFHKYASQEGERLKLKKWDMKKLLCKEGLSEAGQEGSPG